MSLPAKFDDSRMPLRLGSPLKVPSYAWREWGISYQTDEEFEELVRLSENGYREEWDSTGSDRHKYIAIASKMAGLEDANERLNSSVAKVVSGVIKKAKGGFTIVDLGAGTGNTTLSIIKELDRVDLEKTTFILIEPASEALEEAKRSLAVIGLVERKNVKAFPTTDLQIERFIRDNSVDMVVSVASIHHHAYLEAPFRVVYNICKKGGFFLTGDWHNSMWEHPRNVYQLLEEMEWETKEDDLKAFVKTYSKAREQNLKKIGTLEMKANGQIKLFWKHYSELKIDKRNQSMILEGHRPVEQYLECMRKVGFLTDTKEIEMVIQNNPYMVLLDSSLLCLCLGQKGQ